MSEPYPPVVYTFGLDGLLMQWAVMKLPVSGTYFGNEFTGTVTESRQHTVTFRERVVVTLDKPTFIKIGPDDCGRMSDNLIISAENLEDGTHTLRWAPKEKVTA